MKGDKCLRGCWSLRRNIEEDQRGYTDSDREGTL